MKKEPAPPVAIDVLRPKPTAQQQAMAERRRARREERQQAVGAARRGLILDAARAVFAESGLDGGSLREIARRAGYTPGALYSYFDSKEAIYAELLGESLDRLQAAVRTARPARPAPPARGRRKVAADEAQAATPGAAVTPDSAPDPATAQAAALLMAKARGWFDFYAHNPRDLDLGFYLAHGLGPKGLTPELNERLNHRLLQALAPCEDALRAMGCTPDAARREHAALFAHGVGLLLLQHTGRIRLFDQHASPLFDDHLRQLVHRLTGWPADASMALAGGAAGGAPAGHGAKPGGAGRAGRAGGAGNTGNDAQPALF